MKKRALITGISGQDGSYLAELLLEKGIDLSSGNVVVRVSPEFFRPTEVELLVGNPQKARDHLGWYPKTSLQELVSLMVQADLNRVTASCLMGQT